MLLAQFIAGFTPGQADTLRKAMGKKMEGIMNDLEEGFLQEE
jgi:DNA polymerase-3 subunit alpha